MSAEDIQQQQGGGLPSGGAYGRKPVPADIQRQEYAVGNRHVIGGPGGGAVMPPQIPQIPWGTAPVYDTLPANGDRFIFTGQEIVTGNQATNREIFSYTVPAGVVLYLLKARVNVVNTFPPVCSGLPASLGIPPDLISFSLFRNGAVTPFDSNITEEPLDSFYPVFLPLSPNDVLSVRVTYAYQFYFYNVGSVKFLFNLLGDVLKVNDLPPQYTALKGGS